jgi:hypothetical protein
MMSDEPGDQRVGRSISAAKKADAVFKIALALRNSAFSRRRRFNSADSSVVIPARAPASIWAWRTYLRTVSAVPTPKQLRDLTDRGPLRLVLIADLGDHPHRPLTQLRRIPLRRTHCHDSILSKKWSLRTCRGGSLRVMPDSCFG